MKTSKRRGFGWWRWGMLAGLVAWSAMVTAQEARSQTEPLLPASPGESSKVESMSDSVRELREQVRELQAAVAAMRSDWQRARAETAELRRELDEVRPGARTENAVLKTVTVPSGSMPSALPQYQTLEDENSADRQQGRKTSEHSATLDEEYQLLSGKVDDQYQTKVESASKYRVRLSGIVLMNLFSTQGAVDSVDIPTIAYQHQAGSSGGSFGATLRQSQIGFEAFGPTVAGAKIRGDLQLDLAGGFPSVPNGINSGLMRLRTGTIRMDWTNTSVVVGQDGVFFSPNSPTSFASLAVPALSSAGNLWAWVPQIRVEHRVVLGDESNLLIQAGILDPVSGELPYGGAYRQAGPGEASRQPAYGSRIAWTHTVFGQPLRIGMGGFYNRQNYGFSRTVDGWAGMADIELPLSRQFSLGGKLYRGRALGGFYSAEGNSVVYSNDPTYTSTQVRGLNSVGGWAQLKYRPVNKWEFNAAFGMDNPYASDLKMFPYGTSWNPVWARNLGSFANMIYRPRSDLLFSAEYRHLTTYSITNDGASASQLNLMMGVLF